MYIREAIRKYPILEGILRDEFDARTYFQLEKFGESAKFRKGIPEVQVYVEAELEKEFEVIREEGRDETTNVRFVNLHFKNK